MTAQHIYTFTRFTYGLTLILAFLFASPVIGELRAAPNNGYDFGDLPASFNNTLIEDDGAAHALGSELWLGTLVDAEQDGQESENATGDDLADLHDEDGVSRVGDWTSGDTGNLAVTVVGDGCLSGWIDWDKDSDFDDADDLVLDNIEVSTGTLAHTIDIPNIPIEASMYFGRFRLFPRDQDQSCTSAKSPTGKVYGGEVEDHEFKFIPLAVELASFDATADEEQIQVTWETVSERDNLGFNLYRGTTPENRPEQALNAELIPSQAAGSGQGFAYEYADHEIEAGASYLYWLEDVDVQGHRTLHGPIEVTTQAPTAVTLSQLSSDASSEQPSLLWGGLLIGMLGMTILVRRR